MVDLEINKGINDEYLWVLHGSDVELHVGGADQQKLEHQGLSSRQRSWFYHDAFVRLCCLWNSYKLGTLWVSLSAAS